MMKRLLVSTAIVLTSLGMQSFTTGVGMRDTTVYICVTGKVYHSTRSCRGLSNATHEIKAVPLSQAQQTRRACKICY